MENEIAESEVLDMDVELEVYDKVAQAVSMAQNKCANIVLKYDTPQDIKESKSFIYQLRQLKAPIAQAHKEGKAEALKFTRAMDAMKNKLLGAVEEMIDEKYAPIKVIEDAEAAKAKRIEQERVAAEEAEQEKARLELEAREQTVIDQREELRKQQEEIDRKEREADIAKNAKRDAEAAQAKKVMDAEIARQTAEEKARQDAIAAENARKQAIVDAENAKAAAVQKAKDEAAAAVAEKELKREIQEAKVAYEKELADRREQERINDEKHRSDVHRAIYKAIYKAYHTNVQAVKGPAQEMTQLLIDGKIPHVNIQY